MDLDWVKPDLETMLKLCTELRMQADLYYDDRDSDGFRKRYYYYLRKPVTFSDWKSWSEEEPVETFQLSPAEKQKLRSALLPIVDYLPLGISIMPVGWRMRMIIRTAVQYLCEDVPDMAETVLYSDEILVHDEAIEQMTTEELVESYADYVYFRRNYKRHPYRWFRFAENLTHIKGETLEESKKNETHTCDLSSSSNDEDDTDSG